MEQVDSNGQDRCDISQIPEGFRPLTPDVARQKSGQEEQISVKERQVSNVCCTWH